MLASKFDRRIFDKDPFEAPVIMEQCQAAQMPATRNRQRNFRQTHGGMYVGET